MEHFNATAGSYGRMLSDVGRSVTMIIIQSLWLTCTHWCSWLLCIFNQVLLLSRSF